MAQHALPDLRKRQAHADQHHRRGVAVVSTEQLDELIVAVKQITRSYDSRLVAGVFLAQAATLYRVMMLSKIMTDEEVVECFVEGMKLVARELGPEEKLPEVKTIMGSNPEVKQ
jgi:hypothetical protein